MLFKFFDKFLISKRVGSLSIFYRKLVFRTYLQVLVSVFFDSFFCCLKGLFFLLMKKEYKSQLSFIQGSFIWGKKIIRLLNIEVVKLNHFFIPSSKHFIFINHVNEIDIPLDNFVINKPFLANQTIKKMILAYWWAKAMGSEIFDPKKVSTILKSIKRLMEQLHNHSYIVYPEGHNGYKEELQPLMKGIMKIAYDKKIPIYLLLKSGMTQFQKKEHQGTFKIVYKFICIIKPEDYKNSKVFQQFIISKMNSEKSKLDEELVKIIPPYEYTTKR